MTFARPGILRRIPTGPNPVTGDYLQLLAGKLRAAWDVREGGEFGPGVWISHADAISGIQVAAAAVVNRPRAVVDGSNFAGVRVIELNSSVPRSMRAPINNLVPAGSGAEVYCVGRITAYAARGLCGFADAASNSGAFLRVTATGITGVVADAPVPAPFADTQVHLFTSFYDNDADTACVTIDGVLQPGAVPAGLTTAGVSQAAVGGFATGSVTLTADAYVAMWGIANPPMTTAERARFCEIARNDWAF